ncbi:MAG: hypothetical protein WHX52_22115 [Anaerolineae bacterium]
MTGRYILGGILLVGLLLIGLSTCQSPRARFQSEAQNMLDQIPVPNEVNLICTEDIERLAKQGIGTHFGVKAVYGTNLSYDDIAEQYRSLLIEQGWQKFGRTTWEHPWYCNPQYHGIRIELYAFSGSIQCESSPSVTGTNSDFQTFYIIEVLKFPYDDIGGCQDDK